MFVHVLTWLHRGCTSEALYSRMPRSLVIALDNLPIRMLFPPPTYLAGISPLLFDVVLLTFFISTGSCSGCYDSAIIVTLYASLKVITSSAYRKLNSTCERFLKHCTLIASEIIAPF